ncbi:hypothetical protein ES288_D04G194000v1 [Gossypium darwinii]|uniref:Methyltransferase domain-containing protein n=1 Tax=Gossypium darwinii TaxID=34276 RepID=A0A5D2D238_GOSDA|nr:hypothetical protein ES288_D04G194000v1 [Gossypium darwinii]TYG74585.1 hypothetical protein ES288_D04G194000v1 [Gossypium darwinii]
MLSAEDIMCLSVFDLISSRLLQQQQCQCWTLTLKSSLFGHMKPKLEIKVLEADMLDLPFSNECFDVVIEKGTMDVLFVDSGDPWNPQPATISKVMAMLEGVHKVLKPNGIFISITFGQPHFRKPFFHNAKFTWSIEWSTFGDGFHYFFYILRKGRRCLDDEDSIEKIQMPSISLYHEELEGEDYIFRTNIEELNS